MSGVVDASWVVGGLARAGVCVLGRGGSAAVVGGLCTLLFTKGMLCTLDSSVGAAMGWGGQPRRQSKHPAQYLTYFPGGEGGEALLATLLLLA